MLQKNYKPKLYELTGRTSKQPQRSDIFWPMPSTYIGLEIEIEGVNDRIINDGVRFDRRWSVVKDDSLRGGEEWVFAQPLLGLDMTETIDWFFANVSNYKMSTRTSTHVHINMMDDDCDADSLRNTLGLYIAAEDYFFSKAGDERRWSGYCAPLEEAPVDLLVAMINGEGGADGLQRALMAKRANAERYYALNLMSLHKHGTLEFRHFPCTTSKEDIVLWIKMVMWLKLGGIRMSKDNVNIFDVMSEAQYVRDTLIKYIPEMAEEIILFCPEHKIASKIAAIQTYTATHQPPTKYSMDRPGLFRDWCGKKGVLAVPKLDKKEENILKKQKSVTAHIALGSERGQEAEQRRIHTMNDYIAHNEGQRRRGGDVARIPSNIRYVMGYDMLPTAERQSQDETFGVAARFDGVEIPQPRRSLFEAVNLPPAPWIVDAQHNLRLDAVVMDDPAVPVDDGRF